MQVLCDSLQTQGFAGVKPIHLQHSMAHHQDISLHHGTWHNTRNSIAPQQLNPFPHASISTKDCHTKQTPGIRQHKKWSVIFKITYPRPFHDPIMIMQNGNRPRCAGCFVFARTTKMPRKKYSWTSPNAYPGQKGTKKLPTKSCSHPPRQIRFQHLAQICWNTWSVVCNARRSPKPFRA